MDARRADLRALPKSDKIPLTNKKYFVFSLAAILSLALDQWSKVWARANLATGDRVIIPGYFDLTLAQNKGMAFSLLHNLPFGRYFLLIVAIVMLPVIFAIERKTDIRRVRMHVELGLIFGGGLAYTLGALVYATRRFDLKPQTFGYHEVFHAFTLAGAAQHFGAVLCLVRAGAQ